MLESTVLRGEPGDPALVDRDTSAFEALTHFRGHVVPAIGKRDDVARPASQEQREVEHLDLAGEVREPAILHLPAVAVRTLEDRGAPERPEAVDVGQLVDHSRAKQDPARRVLAPGQANLEGPALAADLLDAYVSHVDVAVGFELLAADAPEVG